MPPMPSLPSVAPRWDLDAWCCLTIVLLCVVRIGEASHPDPEDGNFVLGLPILRGCEARHRTLCRKWLMGICGPLLKLTCVRASCSPLMLGSYLQRLRSSLFLVVFQFRWDTSPKIDLWRLHSHRRLWPLHPRLMMSGSLVGLSPGSLKTSIISIDCFTLKRFSKQWLPHCRAL